MPLCTLRMWGGKLRGGGGGSTPRADPAARCCFSRPEGTLGGDCLWQPFARGPHPQYGMECTCLPLVLLRTLGRRSGPEADEFAPGHHSGVKAAPLHQLHGPRGVGAPWPVYWSGPVGWIVHQPPASQPPCSSSLCLHKCCHGCPVGCMHRESTDRPGAAPPRTPTPTPYPPPPLRPSPWPAHAGTAGTQAPP